MSTLEMGKPNHYGLEIIYETKMFLPTKVAARELQGFNLKLNNETGSL